MIGAVDQDAPGASHLAALLVQVGGLTQEAAGNVHPGANNVLLLVSAALEQGAGPIAIVFTAPQGIPLPPDYVAHLRDENGPVDLRGKTVLCRTRSAGGGQPVVLEPATVDSASGVARKQWTALDLVRATTGDMLVQFIVVDGQGNRRTYPRGGRYFRQRITRRPGDTRR